MRFDYTDDQRLIHQTVREFAASELRPHARRWDADGVFPRDLIPKIAALGLWGMTVPPEYGGAGVDMVSAALAIEALAWGDGGIALSVRGAQLAVYRAHRAGWKRSAETARICPAWHRARFPRRVVPDRAGVRQRMPGRSRRGRSAGETAGRSRGQRCS